jgi:hypothetical protein
MDARVRLSFAQYIHFTPVNGIVGATMSSRRSMKKNQPLDRKGRGLEMKKAPARDAWAKILTEKI